MPADGGIRFGQYVLLRRLARGGMAEVFLAEQRGLEGFDRRVAVKRILPHLADSPDFMRMFLGEAKLAAQLTHPNIVHIYDFGKVAADYFIAMEFVDGVHAGQLWKHGERERLPPTLVARIGADAATALHYAHELRGSNGKPLGLVHRDVSPANLMISFDGVVKLCDFGIAKAAMLGDQLTNPGQVKGKYAYMSPEQTIAAPLDGRSDVYSLAICLWELLSGKTIVPRGDAVEAMRAIRDGNIAPIERAAPWTPPALAKAITWALQTRREQRATAMDFAQALEAFIKSAPDVGTPMQLGAWIRARFPRDVSGAQPVQGAPGTAVVVGTSATPESAPPATPPLIAASRLSDEVTSQTSPLSLSMLSTGDPLAATTIDDASRRAAAESTGTTVIAPPRVFPDEETSGPAGETIIRPRSGANPFPPPAVIVEHTLGGETQVRSGAFRPSLPSGPPAVPTIVDSRGLPPPRLDISPPLGTEAVRPMPPPPPYGMPMGAAPRGNRRALAIGGLVGLAAISFAIALAASKCSHGAAPRSIDARPIDAAVVADAALPDAAPPDAEEIIIEPPDAAPEVTTLVEVQTKPDHATVQIGDEHRIAPTKFALPAGRYTITATLDGWEPKQKELDVLAGEHVLIDLAFERRLPGPRAPAAGRLAVRTTPYSEVWLGDKDLGTAPFEIDMAPGTYTLTFRNPLHKPTTRTVKISANKTTKLSFTLP